MELYTYLLYVLIAIAFCLGAFSARKAGWL